MDVLLGNIGRYYINNKLLYYDNFIYFMFINIFFLPHKFKLYFKVRNYLKIITE